MKNDEIKVEANDVVAHYRARVDELEFSNTVLQLQVKALQKQLGDKQVPAQLVADNTKIDNAEMEA